MFTEKLKNRTIKILSHLERYTKTDMLYLAKGSVWVTSSQVVSSLSSFFLVVAFANFIDPETYGNYKYLLSIISLLCLATLPGINTSALRSAAKGFEGTIRNSIKIKIKYGLIGSLMSILIGLYYFHNDNQDFGLIFLLAALFIPILDSVQLPMSIMLARKDFSLYSTIASHAIYISNSVLMIGLILITKSIFGIIIGYFIIYVTTRIICSAIVTKKYKPNDEIDSAAIPYGKNLSYITILNSLAGNLNGIFMFKILGNAHLAVYSIAIAPTEQIRSLLRNLEMFILPKISQDGWKIPTIREFVSKIKFLIIILTIGICIYYFLAPVLFAIFFPQYTEAVPYSQLFSATIVISAVSIILNNILTSKGKLQSQYVVNFVNLFTNLCVVLPALYLWGLYGFIFGIFINKIIEMILLTIFVFKTPSHTIVSNVHTVKSEVQN